MLWINQHICYVILYRFLYELEIHYPMCIRLLSLILLTPLWFLSPKESNASEYTIVTSIKPLASIIESITAEHASVKVLFHKGQSPHDTNLKPSQISLLHQADLLVMINPDFFEVAVGNHPAWNQEQQSNHQHLINNITLLSNRETHHHHSYDHQKDWHIWLDIDHMQQLARNITLLLQKELPHHAEQFSKNLAHLEQSLTSLDQTIHEKFSDQSLRRYVVWHDALRYIEKQYQLPSPIIISKEHHGSISAHRMRDILAQLPDNETICLLQEPNFPDRVALLIAQKNGKNSIVTHKIDLTASNMDYHRNLYSDFMNNLASTMLECMRVQ